jgi:hypothetical protein
MSVHRKGASLSVGRGVDRVTVKRSTAAAACALTALAFTGPALSYTHAQQDAKIDAILAKLKCMTRTPITEFGEPAGSDWGFLWDNTNGDETIAADFGVSALDFDFGYTSPDAWILTVKPTSTCKKKFAVSPTPSWWPGAESTSAKATQFQLKRIR